VDKKETSEVIAVTTTTQISEGRMKSTKKSAIIQVLCAKIEAFFQNGPIETIAGQVKFVQCKSPLTGLRFVQSLVIGPLEQLSGSLNRLAQVGGAWARRSGSRVG
jgi:hypothetical protein